MNKISDLKVGDKVMTIFYGQGVVYEITDKWVLLNKLDLPLPCRPTFCNHEIDWQKTNELNNKQMKEFIIECPSGFEVDKEKSIPFEKIVFKEIENKLPMSVEEIPNRDWFIFNGKAECIRANKHKENLSTKERAEAFLALMQLVELRDAWNGDWKADWKDSGENKFTISVCENKIRYLWYWSEYHVLHFKSEQLRDQFAEQFKDLIETAKELL